jgi:NADPH2:quinone reductase
MTYTTEQTMHAAAIDEFGGSITPHLLPVPQVGRRDILIRVESAGVGAWDPMEQKGFFAKLMNTKPKFPYVLGSEGAGTVAQVGQDVRGFAKGDRVYALALANPKGGFYAEYAVVDAGQVSLVPSKLTVEQAGVMAVDGVTALVGLDDTLKLQKGESILIFGASGGIGHIAVQLAKRMGARVLAVASGEDGVALARRLGADDAIDGRTDDIAMAALRFDPSGLDCVLLTAGGNKAEQALRVVSAGGRVAYPNGVDPTPKDRPGITIESYDGEPTPQRLAKLNTLIEQAPFDICISRRFSLDQAPQAHAALAEHYLGKIALRPASGA